MTSAVLITKEKVYPQEVLDSLPEFDELIIETECPNILRRYELAAKAKGDIIYVQDDDCIIDVKYLEKRYNGRITNALPYHQYVKYEGTGVTLIGYGAFFPKSMINFDRYLDTYGVSELFLTQADRVFTFLNQPFNSVVMDINNLPRATLGDRMYQSEDHWQNLQLIKEQLYELP